MSAGTNSENTGEDHLDRELRSLTEGTAAEARFKEPTAAEREATAKKARAYYARVAKDQARERKRSQKAAKKARRKAWGVKRKHTGLWAWTAAIVILAGSCVFAYSRLGHSALTGGPDDTQLITGGAVPTLSSPPISPRTGSGPPADPFSGTPADNWANGAAGIVIPKATAHGRYSASQVEQAYQTTKKLLIAAALDRQTLNGGAPDAFAKLLTQSERNQFLDGLDKIGLYKNGDPLSTRDWILQFAPGTTKLIGSVIKVHGTMKAVATTSESGVPVLRVNVNYVVAYPVEPPKAPADWMRVAAQFYGTVDFGYWRDADSPFEPWWSAGPATAGGRCGMKDGYVHPEFPSGPPDTVQPSGPAQDPYSFAKPAGEGCHPTTGT